MKKAGIRSRADEKTPPNPGGFYPQEDPRISLAYHKRYLSSLMGAAEEPTQVLKEFFQNHPSDFFRASWIPGAAGQVLLGLPKPGAENQRRARHFFSAYWTFVLSPKLDKVHRLVRARNCYDSRHRGHWRMGVLWMRKQRDWPAVDPKLTANKFVAERPKRCDCLSNPDFEQLCKVAQRSDNLSAGKVVLKYVATLNQISPRLVSAYWSGAKKRTRNMQL